MFSLLMALACTNEIDQAPAAEVHPSPADAPLPPPAADASLAGAWTLDPGTSTIGFVGAKLSKTHEGSFKGFSGRANVQDGTLVSVEAEVDLGSVDTDSGKLTDHLRGEDFFDVAQFPKASFRSSAIEATAEGHTLTGVLDFHGKQNEITVPAQVSVGEQAVTLKSEFSIDRQLWELSYPGKPDDLIQDEVKILLDLSFPRGG
jgi:polyisoprenoid-binding protein YceI